MQERPRRGAGVNVADLDEPVRGNEDVLDDDVVGAGGPHAVGLPDIDDPDVVGGQQGKRRVDRIIRAAERADDGPVAVHHAGGP